MHKNKGMQHQQKEYSADNCEQRYQDRVRYRALYKRRTARSSFQCRLN